MIRVVKVNGLRGESRDGVCYVGRAFAGWPASPWGNPHRPAPGFDAVAAFRVSAASQPPEWLAKLWGACEHGAKPLGCWCVNATHGDGQPVECHAQVLAAMMAERFLTRGDGQ